MKHFWGIALEPNRTYYYSVNTELTINRAILDLNTININGRNQVWITINGDNYLICNLNSRHSQRQLKLSFVKYDQLSLFVIGDGTVHLTGRLKDEPEVDPDKYTISELSPTDTERNTALLVAIKEEEGAAELPELTETVTVVSSRDNERNASLSVPIKEDEDTAGLLKLPDEGDNVQLNV